MILGVKYHGSKSTKLLVLFVFLTVLILEFNLRILTMKFKFKKLT
jgi:hypothetical protein